MLDFNGYWPRIAPFINSFVGRIRRCLTAMWIVVGTKFCVHDDRGVECVKNAGASVVCFR